MSVNLFNNSGSNHNDSDLISVLAGSFAALVIKPKFDLRSIPDEDLDKLINDTYVPEFGARPVNKTIKQYIEDQLI